MKLLFLNRSFWPDLEATGQFLTELCEDLSSEHEVTFIAGPSYHVNGNGRGGLLRREARGRVSIIRTWGTRLPKRWLAARLLNLGTYFGLAALAAFAAERPDVVIGETDPPLLGALGAVLKRRFRCRFVYNVRDLFPDIAEATGAMRSRPMLWLLEVANRFAYRHADLVLVLGEDMRERILAKGVPAKRIRVVPDWVDCGQVSPVATSPFRAHFGDRFVVMYSGNLGLSQQLDSVLEAAEELRDDARILFVLVGEGARKQWLMDRVRERGLDNVRFFPYQPKEKLAESLSAADLHLIPLAPGAAGLIVPSKVYGILGAGRPFVAMLDESSDVARIARQHGVGFVVPPDNVRALAAVLRRAADAPGELAHMGRRARLLAEQKYDRKVATRRFADALAELGGRAAAPSQMDAASLHQAF